MIQNLRFRLYSLCCAASAKRSLRSTNCVFGGGKAAPKASPNCKVRSSHALGQIRPHWSGRDLPPDDAIGIIHETRDATQVLSDPVQRCLGLIGVAHAPRSVEPATSGEIRLGAAPHAANDPETIAET